MSDRFSEFPYVSLGLQYARDVVSGEIPACVYVVGSCRRFLSDIDKIDASFYFCPETAERYLRLVQKFSHVKGKEWSTKTITYEPWQCFTFANIMGFISRATGFRRFRVAHIEVSRGNAKSAMASQAVLYFLALDNPVGNEISTVATKRDQARIVFDSARSMARKCPGYLKSTGVQVLAHKIVHPSSDSFARPSSSDATTLDGLNDILAVMDELHAMKRETFDVVYSGMSKRSDSLLLCITTAGSDVDGVGHSQSAYAKKVATGEYPDDQFFSAVYTIDKDDDIFSEVTWKKANPNWGVSVDPVTFAAKAMKARKTPADLPNFKIKHLDMWISEANAFFSLDAWDKCADENLRIEDFAGEKAFGSADLASKIDLASLGLVFKKTIDGLDHYYGFDRSYIPENRLAEVRNDIYDDCVARGFLKATKGSSIYFPHILQQVVDDSELFDMVDVMVDPWNSLEFSQGLKAKGIEVTEFRMNVGNFSEPTKTLDALIREGRWHHNGSPLLRWAIGNIVCTYDVLDNVLPKKSHEKLKIDPAVALIMALAGWLQSDETASTYEERGFLVF